jgi:hypothetical protein
VVVVDASVSVPLAFPELEAGLSSHPPTSNGSGSSAAAPMVLVFFVIFTPEGSSTTPPREGPKTAPRFATFLYLVVAAPAVVVVGLRADAHL